jgi:hypothetical protein
MDYFYIEYDFDNIFKGGVYGGSQTLHIDIVDSSGNIAFKDAIKLDISPDRCLKERIKKQNYMEFDWENRNIKGIELRLSAAGSQKSCRSNGAGL